MMIPLVIVVVWGLFFSMKLLGFVSKAIKLLLTELVGQCYLFINWLPGPY